ncbi:MAG TPA: CGNR zinc finger domain-containing protein [Solirubrobacter sp.]
MDLPDDLALPLERGASWWYWSGGRPALDFVNTFRERWRRQVETLVTEDDLAEWLVNAQLLPDTPPIPPGLLDRARELREGIDDGLVAVIDGKPVPEATRAVLTRELRHAVVPDELIREPDGSLALRPTTPLEPAVYGLGLVAHDAARMFTPAEAGRIRVCASDTCSGRFYDRSPAAVRRYCSPTGCGNVEKARRHRRRRREQEQPS